MKSTTLEYLDRREWSAGNGQCPECWGAPASWHGHPCYMTPEKIGHESGCSLAEAIEGAGGEPLMMGGFTSDAVYESSVSEHGFFTTQAQGSDPGNRARYEKWAEDLAAARNEEVKATLLNLNWPWLCAMWWPGGFWARCGDGGAGMWFGTYAKNPVLFSERYGYRRVFRLGRWARWEWLRARVGGDE